MSKKPPHQTNPLDRALHDLVVIGIDVESLDPFAEKVSAASIVVVHLPQERILSYLTVYMKYEREDIHQKQRKFWNKNQLALEYIESETEKEFRNSKEKDVSKFNERQEKKFADFLKQTMVKYPEAVMVNGNFQLDVYWMQKTWFKYYREACPTSYRTTGNYMKPLDMHTQRLNTYSDESREKRYRSLKQKEFWKKEQETDVTRLMHRIGISHHPLYDALLSVNDFSRHCRAR